ncbi:ABC transporter ATP-binding protein [Psychrobacter sp. Marseille-P5312]|uniref:ABC transporter ATP-binding protein n=1 Tax=Psychrobacter sp. Marseille-P5312 TaxID=2086574 RepID=UPI0018F89479|nr:ABC transporter ATP-binding protein [Psychrobacter sp. Marseille-P5312]
MYTDSTHDPSESKPIHTSSLKAKSIQAKTRLEHRKNASVIKAHNLAHAAVERDASKPDEAPQKIDTRQDHKVKNTNSQKKQVDSAASPYFSVQDLIVGYDDTIVVDGLSLTLQQGEIGCFLGYSGCGKTTALRAIAGLEQSRGGSIYLSNQRLTDKRARKSFAVAPAKRGMGMVFQDYALFGHLSVAKNIAFGLNKWSTADKKARVAEMLSLVDLTEHADKRPNELSGGQQQRVALARALAPKPKLLLLDEPFSNLDVVLRESLAMSVRDILKRTNTTAILVTHDQNEAFAIADKVGVMHQGKLVQWATPSELYHEPVSPFVAEFVGEGAMIDGIIKEGHVETALGDIYRRMEVYDEAGYPQYCEYDYPNGTPIKVLVRPDDIIHDDDSTQTALVVGRVFRGANYLYRLQLDDGQTVLSLVASHHNHEIGSHIGILPILEHVVVFDETDVNATTWSEYDGVERFADIRQD